MAKQNINVGTAANDKKGDSLRAAFVKVNANFTELYTALGINADGNLNIGAFEFAGSVMSTTDSTAIVIDQATTVTSNLSVGGDLLPQTAVGGNLGSSTLPWRSLYVSNNTIFLGGTALSIDGSGNLTVGGSRVGATSYTDLTSRPALSTVATTGSYTDLTNKPTLFSGSYNDLTNKPNLAGTYQFSVAADDSTQRVISSDELVKFIGAGGITTSSDAEGNITINYVQGDIRSEGNINIDINLSDSTLRRWQFGEDGNLTLPQGGNISEGGGISGAIKLTPAGGANEYQALLIYPTAGEGDHIHLTAGGGTTELYLGNDLHYVKLESDGNIRIQADNGVNGAAWTFGTDGALTIPGDIRSEGNINIDINLADSTLRRWQFGEDGILTLPSVGKISNGAYDWTFGSTGITTFPGVINAGNINNLVVSDAGGGTSLTAGSQVQIGNSAGIAGAGVLIKNAVTNILGGESELESGSKIQMDNGNVSLFGYTYNSLGDGDGLENQLVVEVDNSYLNKVVRIGTRIINTIEGSTTNVFQGVTISQYGELTFPDNTVQTTAWTGFSVAADDSTQRLINAGELVKFIGAGGVTTASDAEGNITITGTVPSTLVNSTKTLSLGSDGSLTSNGVLTIKTPNGVPSSVSNIISNGGFNSVPYTGLATTGGTGTGLTVNANGPGNGYITSITINTAGTGYTAGDVITITGAANLTTTFTIGVAGTNSWTFGTDGKLTVPGDIQSTTSLDITTNHIPYYSNQFSGSQYISIANSSALQLGNATSWTIEAWVYITAYPVSGTMTIIEKDAQVAVSYSTYLLNIASDGKAAIYTGSGDGGHNNPTGKSVVSSTNLPLSQWVHLAAVWNGSNITLYQNGVSVGTVSAATTPITGEGGRAVNIGREDYLNYFAGKISNVRIVKNTAVYTGAFTPSTSPLTAIANTSLLTCNAATSTGTATVINESPFGVYGDKTWAFGTDGSLTLPIGVSIDSSVSPLYPKIIADSGKAFSVQGQGNSGSAALAWSVDPNSAGQYAAVGVTKEGGDNLAKVVLQAQSNSGDGATVKLWKFDETGAFTFPDATVQTTAWTGTTTGAITAGSFNTDQITIVGNRISTTVTNANLEIETSGTGRVVINAIEDATTDSTTRSVGYLGLPPANSSITRTLTIADSGKHTYITAAGVTLTIPAASSVAYPVGTTLTFIAGPSATTVTIAINTDTLRLAGGASTGSRTLAANGMATAVKVSGTSSAGVWYINGIGLT